MNTRLIARSVPCLVHDGVQTAEDLIVYAARVSNPNNQLNTETGDRLLKYCMKHGHWSVFETASMTVEIETTRAIAAQILRHRSFTFQEFSQRYAVVDALSDANLFEIPELRAKAEGGNRQGSAGDAGEVYVPNAAYTANERARQAIGNAQAAYRELISAGIAPECARMVLPLCTKTRLYVTGSCRSWIHYFAQRCSDHAQKEHRELATQIRDTHFKQVFPLIHQIATTEARKP